MAPKADGPGCFCFWLDGRGALWYAYLNRCNFAKCKFSEMQGSANACFPADKPLRRFTPEAPARKAL